MHTAQLMPVPLTVSCFSKIQIGFTFLVPAHPCSPGQRAVKRVCVYRTGLPGQMGLRVAGFPGHWVAGSRNVAQFHLWRALTSAHNYSLLSLLRQLTTWHCSHLSLNAVLLCCRGARRPPLSINIACPPGPQQQTRCTLLQRSKNGTDRQTDGHRPVTQTLPHTMRAVSKTLERK